MHFLLENLTVELQLQQMLSISFKTFESNIITYLYHPIERATTPAATAAPHPAMTAVNKNTIYCRLVVPLLLRNILETNPAIVNHLENNDKN